MELSDEQQFGMNDDDNFEATTETVMVGGAAMYPNKTIVENASAASNLTTLVSLVQMADLVETLSSDGPFTVFAPTNTAFSMLPSETTTMLTKPENKEALAGVLTAHVISGTVTSGDLMAQLANGGSYTATTVSGDSLTFYKMGDAIRVADENGTLARIENADVMQSNGVVHVVSSVLVPK
ncbi:fasciclin domain-containing protein [Litorimonas sp. RW-G-Af-16]